ncbi:hypothetical protein Nepgr_003870 [Nepenthes gracilis]|uniref:Uncharacterized protein n=1 Tax=Nepenthes gracilis TaxID=150966 RepID=A0AAD3S0G3_NEPGR|nr:hypothetical protein Nepgr_003870 [Nepenthes gracilis]
MRDSFGDSSLAETLRQTRPIRILAKAYSEATVSKPKPWNDLQDTRYPEKFSYRFHGVLALHRVITLSNDVVRVELWMFGNDVCSEDKKCKKWVGFDDVKFVDVEVWRTIHLQSALSYRRTGFAAGAPRDPDLDDA